ncbi:hypothetical protein OB955_20030 [Halobacteria archaeon AArc-m2/3/4]|uniref:Uncharacterized protein n=1 Tax=Natronoglomus mannanivorans TaxID=2979990 RepID=A0ABT2QJ98_9EURY|nr:hypothetical protein [Halobacteria archaeon AArc-m2/3/4]
MSLSLSDTTLGRLLVPLLSDTAYVPTRSAITATVIALGAVLAGSIAIGATGGAAVGIVLGTLLAGAIAAVDHDRLRGPLVGGGVLLATTATVLGLPAYLSSVGEQASAMILLAGVLITYGLASFRIDAVGNGAVSRAIAWVVRVGILLVPVTLVTAIVFLDVQQLIADPRFVGVFGGLLAPRSGSEGVLGLSVLLLLTLVSLWLIAAVVPPEDVFDQPFRDRYHTLVATSVRLATLLFGGGALAVIVAYVLSSELEVASGPIEPLLDAVVTSAVGRGLLLRLLLVAVVVTVLLRLLRAAGPSLVYGRPAWLPSGLLITAILVAVGLAGANPLIEMLAAFDTAPAGRLVDIAALLGAPTVAMGLVVLGVLTVGAALFTLPALAGLGLLPTYTAGPRLVLGGLLLTSIAMAVGDAPAVLVFATVVAAIIVWDVGEYGAELTADIGTTPARRDGELLHAGGSLFVGIAVVTLLVGVQRLLTSVEITDDVVLTVIGVGVITVIVVAVLLRE